jgi:glucosamine--fructose-6-phosphate aminotransferase (isomerizing)
VQKQDKAMLELAKQLIDCNSLMFFARGNNYATALEAALKVTSVGTGCGFDLLGGPYRYGTD